MGYYRGDYYRGDYYRGDFLGIGKFLKKTAKVVGGAVIGGLTGGPLGAIGGAIGAAASGGGGSPAGVAMVPYQPPANPPGIQLPGGISIDPIHALPGGQPLMYNTPGSLQQRPAGYHVRKSNTYRFRDGSIHYAGTEWVKNRQMNPANVRALRRAIRRAKGFEHLARQVLSFTSPHTKTAGKKVVFKKSR